MRVRKVLLASLLAIGVLGAGGPAIGAPPEGKGGGPACAEIVSIGGSYTPAPGGNRPLVSQWQGVVSPVMTVAAPSCKAMTYTVYILDNELVHTVLGSPSVQGDGSTTIDFGDTVVTQESGDANVCVYATSSVGNGHHVFDRRPAEGCVTVEENDSPTDDGWNP